MRDVAVSNKVPYLWMKYEDYKYEWFMDWYHLNKDGENKKASLIEKGLEGAHLISG